MASNLHACAELFAHPELEAFQGPHERSSIGKLQAGVLTAGALIGDSRAHQKPKFADRPSLMHWASTLTFAIVMRLLSLWGGSSFPDGESSVAKLTAESQARAIVQQYAAFVDRAQGLEVDRAIERPKVIDVGDTMYKLTLRARLSPRCCRSLQPRSG